PIILVLNVIPFAVFLFLSVRVLDRQDLGDWTWSFCLISAAFGTYLLPFTQTLNNHTIAAFSTFFALYQFQRIWDGNATSPWRFTTAGVFASFAAANELPALAFLVLLSCLFLARFCRKTLLFFIPAAAIPLAGFAGSQFAAFGEFK